MSNSATDKKYHGMWQATADVIRDWDPYGFLAGSSPRDEFDSEISSVVALIPRIQSARDAAHAISRVFSSSFEPEKFSPDLCSGVGLQLFQRLKDQGFLP